MDRRRVYYISNRGELMCLDLQGFYDNENVGPFREESFRGRTGAERTDADVVWSLDMVGKLGVFKRDAGDIGNPTSSPLVVDDLVYCVTGNGSTFGHPTPCPVVPAPRAPSFLAARRDTGHVVWTSNAPGDRIMYAQWSSPVACRVNGKQRHEVFLRIGALADWGNAARPAEPGFRAVRPRELSHRGCRYTSRSVG